MVNHEKVHSRSPESLVLRARLSSACRLLDGIPLVVKRSVTASRWTFIIGLDAKIAYKNIKVDPAADSKQVADFIAKLPKQ